MKVNFNFVILQPERGLGQVQSIIERTTRPPATVPESRGAPVRQVHRPAGTAVRLVVDWHGEIVDHGLPMAVARTLLDALIVPESDRPALILPDGPGTISGSS
jgi:hypothetical protein